MQQTLCSLQRIVSYIEVEDGLDPVTKVVVNMYDWSDPEATEAYAIYVDVEDNIPHPDYYGGKRCSYSYMMSRW